MSYADEHVRFAIHIFTGSHYHHLQHQHCSACGTATMADALCGPSNSLQQFKQQTSLDRTLQQDRLSSRHVPTQGFRSRDPHAGLLDPEFEAFQAGLPAPDLPQYQPFPQQQQPPQAFQAPSWASDFQRMHISAQGPPPFQQQSLPQQARPQSAAWAQGFREQLSQGTSRAHPQTSSPSPIAFQQQARYGYSGYQSNLAGQPTFAPTVQSKGKEPVTEQFDEAAFERAFDQAKDDLMTDVHDAGLEQDASDMQDFANALNVDVDDIVRSDAANVETLREFAMEGPTNLQTMPLEKQQGEESTQHDQRGEDDALAATAQELLEKVEHNQSDKFRNSQFLGLMRKLRDREVKVEGDKMVEQTVSSSQNIPAPPVAASTTLHPSNNKPGALSPHDSSYGSGGSTPHSTSMSVDGYHFDTHICAVDGCETDHTYDHWESPVH